MTGSRTIVVSGLYRARGRDLTGSQQRILRVCSSRISVLPPALPSTRVPVPNLKPTNSLAAGADSARPETSRMRDIWIGVVFAAITIVPAVIASWQARKDS
jgi:hypothetical protein